MKRNPATQVQKLTNYERMKNSAAWRSERQWFNSHPSIVLVSLDKIFTIIIPAL